VKEYGEADAFGHRKKKSVAENLSDEIKRATGEETVVSDLTYDLRSGSPDFVDRLVAFTFAGMAMDALGEAKSGLMTAINERGELGDRFGRPRRRLRSAGTFLARCGHGNPCNEVRPRCTGNKSRATTERQVLNCRL
jgi:hypothetical protein